MESEFGLLFAIVAILLCLLATIFALLIYSGLFTTVDIRAGKPPFEELLIAYKFARGPYKNAGSLFTEVTCLVPQLKSIGVYYDDPSEVASSDLRYVVGAILGEGAAGNVAEGETAATGSNEYETLLTGKGFKVAKFPSVSYALHTVFPFKNTLSIFLAVGRVYPKLSAYMRERSLCAHPMIEVYDDGVIHFVAPLSKQDDFYVAEAKEERNDGEADLEDGASRRSSGQEESPDDEQRRTETQVEREKKEATGTTSKEGSNGSEEESTGSSFEELDIDH